MNILIVDDDYNKIDYISLELEYNDSKNRIRSYSTLDAAISFIERNKDYIDLIILDWCFPKDSISRPQYAMGRALLSYMNFNDINIDVIICSSDTITINKEEYPFVKGAIVYNYSPIMDQVEELLNPKPNKDKKNNKSLKRKKTDPETGYKRRKSSQPWWQK
jgi:response regulator of citrate/malate metabolism